MVNKLCVGKKIYVNFFADISDLTSSEFKNVVSVVLVSVVCDVSTAQTCNNFYKKKNCFWLQRTAQMSDRHIIKKIVGLKGL